MKKLPIFTVAMIVLAICLCISCGTMFSNFAMSIFYQEKITESGQKIYAIVMKSGDKKDVLESEVADFQSKNAAGYIYEKDKKFYIIANIYENKNDATKVKENLNDSGTQVDLLEIDLIPREIEGNFDAAQKLVLSNCLKADFNTFKKLYDVSVSLDTGVYNQLTAKFECNNIYSEFISIKSNFETLFSDLNDIQKNLDKTAKILSQLVGENYSNSTQTFSSLIKQTYCKLILDKNQ